MAPMSHPKIRSAIFMCSVVTGLLDIIFMHSMALKSLIEGVPMAWYKSLAFLALSN
jgi:hypothetical protein